MSCNQDKVVTPMSPKDFPSVLAPQHAQVISSYLQSVASEQFGAEHLNPRTADLIGRFAAALAEKLAAAEKKYGYSDGWADPGWMDECRAKLLEHVGKGDPRDVAAYAAFLWHQGESTAARKVEVGVGASGWRVPLIETSFGTVLDHGIHDTLVLVMHRGTQGWHVGSANAHALLPHQVYVKSVEPLCVDAYEIAVVGLNGGGWRTVWAASDSEVMHPIEGVGRRADATPVVDDPAGSLRWLDRRIADMGDEDKTAEVYQHYINLRTLIRMGSAPVPMDSMVLAARNAELAIRNCVTAGQIGAGYARYADDLRDAVQRLVQQPAAVTQPDERDVSNGSGDVGDKSDWVMVPRVPTEAMGTARRMYGDTSDWWTAVIAAAPEPPSAPVGLDHLYAGDCPDITQPHSRDPHCPACKALAQPPSIVTQPTEGALSSTSAPVGVLSAGLLRWVKAQADDPDANPRFRELHEALAQQPSAVATDGDKAEAQRGPVGTVTRCNSRGDAEVLEHRIELDPAFDESLNALPAGTVVKLYAYPQADAALTQVRSAAASLAGKPAADADKSLLDAVASNYWGLIPFDMPTPGGDDADVGWRVIEYHRAAPRERVVAEHFHDDPRQALIAAIDQAQGRPAS